MKPKDYKCKCGYIKEMWVNDTVPFPESIKCEKCGNKMRKVFPIVGTKVLQGKAGNAKNGYTSNDTYIKKT